MLRYGRAWVYHKFRRQKGWVPDALIGDSPENIFDNRVPVEPSSFLGHTYNATDYMGELYPEPGTKIKVSDTVIYGFRTQVFVTRAYVAVVKGIQSGNIQLLGIFDRANNLLDERLYPLANGNELVKELVNKI